MLSPSCHGVMESLSCNPVLDLLYSMKDHLGDEDLLHWRLGVKKSWSHRMIKSLSLGVMEPCSQGIMESVSPWSPGAM